MTRLIGAVFVLLCPWVGGSLLVAAIVSNWTGHDAAMIGFGVWSVVWTILYALWFDGSKYQHSL